MKNSQGIASVTQSAGGSDDRRCSFPLGIDIYPNPLGVNTHASGAVVRQRHSLSIPAFNCTNWGPRWVLAAYFCIILRVLAYLLFIISFFYLIAVSRIL